MSLPPCIFVTGGAGFIGANFAHLCLAETDYRVVNLDKLTYAGNLENLEPCENDQRHTFVHGDVGDRNLVRNLLKTHLPCAIANFAAESHVDRSIEAPDDFIQTNVLGTFNLLQEVRHYWENLAGEEKDAFRFLHVSTDEVYGSLAPSAPAFSETTPYAPTSPYAASKAASDHLVRAYHHTYGLPALTTNCSNNYGPYQYPEKLIPLVIHNALNGKAIPVYGDGSNIRDWIYVVDHCRAVLAVFQKGGVGEVYNIGANCEKTNLEVVTAVCSVLDEISPRADQQSYATLIELVADRPGHDRRYAIDTSKIKGEIAWSPEETFESGIRKAVRWYLDNEQWVRNVTSGDYPDWIEKNYGKR